MKGTDHHVSGSPQDLESTAALLCLVRDGDGDARDRLLRRYLPALRRWAHGRLPDRARGMVDTDDLVQVSLIRALNQVARFEPRHDGAFLAYLRRIVLNAIRDEIRRSSRRPGADELSEELADHTPSPVELAVGREVVESYEKALASLPEPQQEAVIMRVELGFSYQEIATAMGSPSPNAPRMMVSRALLRLAEGMNGRP
jgi:RNA polymerase sigma factor (sigma-70 family)